MATTPRSRKPWIIGGVLLVVVALGVGLWFYALKGDADPELKLSNCTSGKTEKVDVAALAGAWKVVPGDGDDATTAGYRVQEKFAGGVRKVTANGRTPDVTGSLTVDGGKVTKASLTVDMTTLESDRDMRDNAIRDSGLQTNTFPEATFELTEPIELPEITNCKKFEQAATGDLTLHGETQPITLDITARVEGDTVAIQGKAPIQMADYNIEPPNRPGFVEVDDNGSFEFLISLEK